MQVAEFATTSYSHFLSKLGDVRFSELISRLRCQKCGQAPAPVYLCASHHREACGGPPPDWAIELVPEPDSPLPYKLLGMRKHLGRIVLEPTSSNDHATADRPT